MGHRMGKMAGLSFSGGSEWLHSQPRLRTPIPLSFPYSQADSASLSASLLADWLEGHGMNPADIESLQREIQMDSPMLLSDLPDLQEP